MNGSRSSNGEWSDEREQKRPELIPFGLFYSILNGLLGSSESGMSERVRVLRGLK